MTLRVPPDLIEVMDQHCRDAPGVFRTLIVIAALRAYLKVKAPAETIGEKKR
jgi:hypothetical protein